MLIGPLLDGGLRLAADDAAGVGAVRRADGRGDGGVRRRRRRRSATTASSCPPGRYRGVAFDDRARRVVGQLPAGDGGGRRRPGRRSRGLRRDSAAGRRRVRRPARRGWAARSATTAHGLGGRARSATRRCAASTSTWPTSPTSCRRSPSSPRSPTTPTTDHRRRVHPGQGERPPRRPRRRAGQLGADGRRRAPTGCASSRPAAARRRARHPPRPPPGDGVRRARHRRRRRSRSPIPTSCRRAGRGSGRCRDDDRPDGRVTTCRDRSSPRSTSTARVDRRATASCRSCGASAARRRSPRGSAPASAASVAGAARGATATGSRRSRRDAVVRRAPGRRRRRGSARRSPRDVAATWLRPDAVARLALAPRRRATTSCSCRRRSRRTCGRSASRSGVDGVRGHRARGRRRRRAAPASSTAATAAARRRSAGCTRWLDEHHGGRAAVELWAYGDSAGDRELLADADHPRLGPRAPSMRAPAPAVTPTRRAPMRRRWSARRGRSSG